MNLVARHDHYTGYRRVNTSATCGVPLWHKNEDTTRSFVKDSVSWKWHKVNFVTPFILKLAILIRLQLY